MNRNYWSCRFRKKLLKFLQGVSRGNSILHKTSNSTSALKRLSISIYLLEVVKLVNHKVSKCVWLYVIYKYSWTTNGHCWEKWSVFFKPTCGYHTFDYSGKFELNQENREKSNICLVSTRDAFIIRQVKHWEQICAIQIYVHHWISKILRAY